MTTKRKRSSGTLKAYIASRVTVDPNGCWIWNLYLDKNGYGKATYRYKNYRAHRLSYIAYEGIIPDELLVCHKCDVPACVNPAHIFIGTQSDNMMDMYRKSRRVFDCVGSKSPRAKINETIVTEIKYLLSYGYMQRHIAEMYDVHRSTISSIHRNLQWRNVQ